MYNNLNNNKCTDYNNIIIGSNKLNYYDDDSLPRITNKSEFKKTSIKSVHSKLNI
jgi:hypothetical protein